MRRLTALGVAALAASGAACANRGVQPPGGVIDKTPPSVSKVSPESGSVNQRPGAVRFSFSRVLNHTPPRGEFNQYFLISPTDGEPRVNWHRDRIDVRPRHGFRANTAYTVTLLPGLSDVQGNAMTKGTATVFSTGASLPQFGIVGSIFDWGAERPASGALVEAISRPDSVVYLAVADSLGQYTIGPFGPGRYTLLGYLDRNNNRARDPGELWDSTTVIINRSRLIVELLAILRDTIPPRMSAISRDDSLTLRVTFDRALDPAMPLTPALFRVQRADSTEVPIAAVIGSRAASDSAARRDSARADTTRREAARRDTGAARPSAPPGAPPSVVPLPTPAPPAAQRPAPTVPSVAAPPAPRPSRRAPETILLVKLAPPAILQAGATYRVTARAVRSIVGRAGTTTRTFTVPKPPPPTTRDTTRGRDTTRAQPPRRRPPER